MREPVGALRGITVDVSDLDRGAAFWGQILDVGTRHRQGTYAWLDEVSPGVQLILQEVGDVKMGKNRVHMEIVSDEPEGLVARVEALGGRKVSEVEEDDYALTVLADPDGIEFCVLSRLSTGLASAVEMRKWEKERR